MCYVIRRTIASEAAHSKPSVRGSWNDRVDRPFVPPKQIDCATYAPLLRWCADLKALCDGKRIHIHVVQDGLEQNVLVGNLLVQMYGQCGALEDARVVFAKMHQRNAFVWNCLIRAHAQQGQDQVAFQLFDQMQREGVTPDKFTFTSILSLCTVQETVADGERMHASILRSGFEADIVVATALVNMYGKCDSLEEAKAIFDRIQKRDIVSWNAMIAAYSQHGQGQDALHLLHEMQREGIFPNTATFSSVLSTCTSTDKALEGRRLHACIWVSDCELDVLVGTALVNMYSKCGCLEDARTTFDKMPRRDVVAWNALIAGYTKLGQYEDAIRLLTFMQWEGAMPDKNTFVSMLHACDSQATLSEVKEIHGLIVSCGFEQDVVVGSALVNMYGKSNCLDDARRIFDRMLSRDVFTWTSMISGYAQHWHGKDALKLFYRMLREEVLPDKVTFLSILDACASCGVLATGKLIHAHILTFGFESDLAVGTALVNMYGKCGSPDDSRKLFERMPRQEPVSWNAMIVVHAQHGQWQDALRLFQEMQWKQVLPGEVTFASVLDACATCVALVEGKRIHLHIISTGHEIKAMVATALVNMYGKCGRLEDARRIFDEMPIQDIVCWTAMIAVYAQHGQGKEALKIYNLMEHEDVVPDKITFVTILSACSHAGLVNEGRYFFTSMKQDHGISPTVDHYVCMIDLFGRSGCLEEADKMLNNMPLQPSVASLMALLSACRYLGDVERAERVAQCLLELDPENDAPYVMLSNIYGAQLMHMDY